MTKRCRGRLCPPRPTKKPNQTNWIIEMSIKNGSRFEAGRIPSAAGSRTSSAGRQAVVPLPQPPLPPLTEYSYLSSEAMNLPQK